MNDPLGLFDEEPQDPLGLFDGGKTSITEDLKTAVSSVLNTGDTALSLALSVPMRPMLGKDVQDEMFRSLNKRIEERDKWANPGKKKQGLGGELLSGAVGLLPNLALSPLSPVETAKRFLDAGESGTKAAAAGGVDALGQILGYKFGPMGASALSRMFSGAGVNAAQDVATRKIIQEMAATPEMQQAYEFSPSSTILSGAMGGVFGGITTPKQKQTKPPANLKGLEETIAPKEDVPQRTSSFTVDQVPENLRAQQEVFNRTPEQYNPLRRYGEPNAVDHSNQIDLPFTEGPELIREAQVEGSSQPDMFVDLQKQDRAADPVMENMQEQLFKDAIEQPVKDVETDAAYQQRTEQQNLEAGVSRLQDKFSSPKNQRGSGQRGAIDIDALTEGLAGLKIALSTRGDVLQDERGQWKIQQMESAVSVPRSQRGGVDLGPQSSKVADLTQEDVAPIKAQQDKAKKARNLLGTDEGFRANFNTPEEVIAAAPESKDIRADQLLRGKTVTAGINRIAGATNNPVIKYVRDTVRKGFRSAENFARVHITDKQGMGPLWEKMSQQEKNEVWQTWGMGDKNETTFTPEQLRANGFNERQISFMEKLYKASDELYTKAQESYEHAGLKGFRKRAGWRPGIFTGDYKTIFSVPKMKDGVAVLDKHGKPVLEPIGIISADTKWQRDAIIKKLSSDLKQKYPGAIAEDLPRTNLGGKGKSVTMLGDMAKVMDLLGGNDAAFKEVQDKIKEITAQVGSTMYGANLHALEKKGIFGNEGNKPWLNENANTNEGMRAFFKYVEEAAMSYEMLKTQVDVTGLLSNPALDHMQNAKQYVQDYMKQATGRGVSTEGAALNTLMDAPFKTIGIGPSVPREVIHQLSKRMGQLTMGMLNMPFLAMQLLQVPQTAIPEMLGLARNADVSGLEFTKAMSKASIDASMAMFSKWFDIEPKGFQKDVIDYAHDNGLMNFSEFEDVTKITQSKGSRRFDAVADWNRIAGEAATRPLVFFAFARMLENSGLPKKEILDLAYNKTQYAMIDYTPMERPMMYTKAGEIGKMAGGLKTFQHGFIGQQIDWIRRAKQGDVVPLLSGLAMAVLGAGITGATAYEELDYIFGAITDKLGKRQTIREIALKNLPTWLQDGVLSDKTNTNVQSRLGMADVVPNGWADFLSPYASTMGRMATSAYDLAVDPNKTTASNAALAWSPSSMRGVVENTLFKDREGAQKDKEERVDYPRTERDWKLRYFGLTSMEESKAKKELFTDSLAKLSDDEARAKVLTRMKIGFRRSPSFGTTEEFAKYKDIYINRGGDPNTLISSIEQDLVESRKTRKQRMEGIPTGSVGSINRYKSYND